MSLEPEVDGFSILPPTRFLTLYIKDPKSNACAIIDSVLDIDYATRRLAYDSADRLIDAIQ
jgi:hypothetical protein